MDHERREVTRLYGQWGEIIARARGMNCESAVRVAVDDHLAQVEGNGLERLRAKIRHGYAVVGAIYQTRQQEGSR